LEEQGVEQQFAAAPPLEQEELHRLIRRAQEGDAAARERLVQANLRLVWHLVNRFRGAPLELEELFQVGCVGLLKAIAQFDLSYNVRFSTYAVPVILGEIRRELRESGLLKAPRSQKQLATAIRETRRRLIQELGQEPTLDQLAGELEVDRAEIIAALEATQSPLSLFAAATTGEAAEDAPLLIERLMVDDETWFESVAVREVLTRLEERERQLIILRFFQDKTQAEVGEILGMSQVQVSRLERQILARLRQRLQTTDQ